MKKSIRNKSVMRELQSADLHTARPKSHSIQEGEELCSPLSEMCLPRDLVLHWPQFCTGTASQATFEPQLTHTSYTCGLKGAPQHPHLIKTHLGGEEMFGLSLPFNEKSQRRLLLPKHCP